jgi:DNA-binding MarR family transcriptional regulator
MKRQPTCICVNLRRAARAVSHIYDQALAPSGIKITQFSLLRAVAHNEPVAVSALAEELELDRTTMARNLTPLERDGLVVLATGSDQRVTEVRLTAGGRAAIAKALPLWENAQAQMSQLLARGRTAQLGEIAVETSEAAAKLKSKAALAAPVRANATKRRSRR